MVTSINRDEISNLGIYFREIDKYPLLTPDEEIELAKRIKKGDEAALEELVEKNLRFVVRIARENQGRGLPMEDLIGCGNVGLITAARRFDETNGAKFITYAVWWIRQAINRALDNDTRTVRLPVNREKENRLIVKARKDLESQFGIEPEASQIAEYAGLDSELVEELTQKSKRHLSLDSSFDEDEDSLYNRIADENSPNPEEGCLDESERAQVRSVVDSIEFRNVAYVLIEYFGLNGDEPKTYEQIGRVLDLTRERVRQIKERGLRILRHPSKARLLLPYFEGVVDPALFSSYFKESIFGELTSSNGNGRKNFDHANGKSTYRLIEGMPDITIMETLSLKMRKTVDESVKNGQSFLVKDLESELEKYYRDPPSHLKSLVTKGLISHYAPSALEFSPRDYLFAAKRPPSANRNTSITSMLNESFDLIFDETRVITSSKLLERYSTGEIKKRSVVSLFDRVFADIY